MPHHNHEKYITITAVTGFASQFFCFIISLLLYPPDYSGEFPKYAPESSVIIMFGMALNIAASTTMGIKLADERKVLPAAGFTMLAISMGVMLAAMFEVTTVFNKETFEKMYYINTCANFLYVPSLLMISTYDGFKKWVRYGAIIAVTPIFISCIIFLFHYRNYVVLDLTGSAGYISISLIQVIWGLNVYANYKRNKEK